MSYIDTAIKNVVLTWFYMRSHNFLWWKKCVARLGFFTFMFFSGISFLFETESDISEYDKTYDIPKSIMKIVGLRLMREDGTTTKYIWNLFYWFEFFNLFVATFLELVNMAQTAQGGSFEDAVEIFKMMPCVGYLIMALTKSYKITYYRPVYENIVSELRRMWPRGSISKEEYTIVSRSLKHLNIIIKSYFWCNNALQVIFLSPPFVEIIKRCAGMDVPLIFPFFYWFPFDPFRSVYYEVILALQTWHGSLVIWFMLCSDLLFCIFMSHITTEFELLSLRINNLVYVPTDDQLILEYPLSRCDKGSKCDDYEYKDWERAHIKELAEIIIKHRALIRLSGDVESMFSFALLVNFINSSVIICFCGFCSVMVEKWNVLVYKSFMTTALSQTWLLCWYGQRLLDSSESVADAFYNSGWYQTSKRVKSSVFIILLRAQKNVRVTTYGFSILCLGSYTTILKTSWSYFTLLLNTYKK